MSIEERLFAIANQCRSQEGDGFLTGDHFISRLSSQAPDLFTEIKALSQAFRDNVAGQVASAPDRDAAVKAAAKAVAGKAGVGMAAANAAVNVALQIGPIAAAQTQPVGGAAAAPAGDWAGDSMVAGLAPQPQYIPPPPPQNPAQAYAPVPPPQPEPAKQDWYKNKFVLGGAAAVVLFLAYSQTQNSQQQQPPPQPGPTNNPQPGPTGGPPQPGPTGGGQQPPSGGGQQGFPLLQPPSAQPSTLQVQNGPNNTTMIGFAVQTRSGPASMVVMVPAGGWDSSPAFVGAWPAGTTNFSQTPPTAGNAIFQYGTASDGTPVRYAVPQWQQDGVGFGQICIGFQGRGQSDVPVRGSTLCVLDGQCQQVAGCGRVP